jgi:hypothetical protein
VKRVLVVLSISVLVEVRVFASSAVADPCPPCAQQRVWYDPTLIGACFMDERGGVACGPETPKIVVYLETRHCAPCVYTPDPPLGRNKDLKRPPDETFIVDDCNERAAYNCVGSDGNMVPMIIRPGDTLSGFAQRFGTTVESLAEINEIPNPVLIFAAETLLADPC